MGTGSFPGVKSVESMELGPPSLLYNGYRVFPGGKIRGIDETGAHPASYTMGTGSFPGGKVARAWR